MAGNDSGNRCNDPGVPPLLRQVNNACQTGQETRVCKRPWTSSDLTPGANVKAILHKQQPDFHLTSDRDPK